MSVTQWESADEAGTHTIPGLGVWLVYVVEVLAEVQNCVLDQCQWPINDSIEDLPKRAHPPSQDLSRTLVRPLSKYQGGRGKTAVFDQWHCGSGSRLVASVGKQRLQFA